MYVYTPDYGSGTVTWSPDDEQLGRQAIKAVAGETDTPIKVDKATAEEIRSAYADLHVDKYGADSRFSE